MRDLHAFLSAATVDTAVYSLRPDYRAMLIAVDGIEPGPSDDHSEALLTAAEASAHRQTGQTPIEQLPHIAAWRAAYRAFGAKPQRTRNSVEALTRRAAGGLPRVNRLTDIYNAVSVMHQLPIGGEDLDSYSGAPHLVRATGHEPFDTIADGTGTLEHPDPGEVIWRDEIGVTCRRWNWRQGLRTQLHGGSRSVLFILDVLDPMTNDDLKAAAETLVAHVTQLGPQVRIARRLIFQASTTTNAPHRPSTCVLPRNSTMPDQPTPDFATARPDKHDPATLSTDSWAVHGGNRPDLTTGAIRTPL